MTGRTAKDREYLEAERARDAAIRKKRRRQAIARAKAQRRRGKRRGGFWSIISAAAAAAVAALSSGCASAPAPAAQQIIMRPCQADMPERPLMPTEHLDGSVTLDDFVRATIAEIERREGYEIVLRAALVFCKSGDLK